MSINNICDGGKDLKLQPLLIIVMLTLLIQGWTACSEDQNKKILQFNPGLALSSGTFSHNSLGQFILPDAMRLTPDQTSVDTPLTDEIRQDLKAILQIPLVTRDLPLAAEDLNQDELRRQVENGFGQIIETSVELNDLRELSNEFSFNQGIANKVNSNINSLMDNRQNWDISREMDLDPQELTSSASGRN